MCLHNQALHESEQRANMKKFIITLIIALTCMVPFGVQAKADQLTPDFTCSDGSQGTSILDNDSSTMEHFEAGTTITMSSEQPIKYVYVKWDRAPGSWKLTADSKDIACGENEFLHELVTLSSMADEVTITIPEGGATLVDLYIYSDGELPEDVQEWLPSAEGEADVLLLSTHADDEVLFFGGIIPNYTNKEDVKVQVAYFTEHYSTGENMRMQEALDGLWTMGVRYYPQFGEFYDYYSESLDEAEAQYDHDAGLEYVVRTIRRFKPQVLIGQDLDGEYGHGCHMLTALLCSEAIEITDDASQYPESASKYGTWKVPKTYLHLYPENAIELNARVPLENLGGKTALELAKEAYLKHVSQQWCWFYVSDGYDDEGNPDGYEYSCTKYGLFNTNVGADTVTDDILDNITPYALTNAILPQPEIQTDENGEPVTDENGETMTVPEPETVTDESGEVVTDENGEPVTADISENETKAAGTSGKGASPVLIIIIIIVVIVVVIIIVITLRNNKKKREMERRRRARMARERNSRTAQGRSGQYPQGQGTARRTSGNSRNNGRPRR